MPHLFLLAAPAPASFSEYMHVFIDRTTSYSYALVLRVVIGAPITYSASCEEASGDFEETSEESPLL